QILIYQCSKLEYFSYKFHSVLNNDNDIEQVNEHNWEQNILKPMSNLKKLKLEFLSFCSKEVAAKSSLSFQSDYYREKNFYIVFDHYNFYNSVGIYTDTDYDRDMVCIDLYPALAALIHYYNQQ
ncbi:unnamed protein product, partial [Didymodactylos carnosus]